MINRHHYMVRLFVCFVRTRLHSVRRPGLLICLKERSIFFVLTLMADVVATYIIVFLFSVAFRNASLYDPYWSIAPFIIAFTGIWQAPTGMVIRSNLLIAALFIWGVRALLRIG
jgi:steroid 5-alpha reductase family enzyme